MVLIGASVSLLAYLLLMIFALTDRKISKFWLDKIFCLFGIAILIFAMFFTPNDFIRWDLLQHLDILDNMRAGGWEYAINNSPYKDLFIYNAFAYLISLLPENFENLISVIPLCIDFLIIRYIVNDITKRKREFFSSQPIAVSYVCWIMLFGLKLAITGIRCSLCVSICAIAIYWEYICKEKRIFSLFLYLIALFIHNFALLIVVVRIVSIIKKQWITLLLCILFALCITPISEFMVGNINNQYLVFIFERILDTWGYMRIDVALKTFSTSTLMVYFGFIILSVILFFITQQTKKRMLTPNFRSYDYTVINWAGTIAAIAIGLSFNYLYLERFMYIVSFAFAMMMPFYYINRKVNVLYLGIFLCLCIFVFFFNDIYIFIVNYVGSYFLAQ